MGIQLIYITHKTAPGEIRGLFSFSDEQVKKILAELMEKETIREAVLLTTCNRTELYCSSRDDTKAFELMRETLLREAGAEGLPGISDHLLRVRDQKAVHHLFLVTAGLDSMVLGEDQILGQVKRAFAAALDAGSCKSTFRKLFQAAVTGAKKVKNDTMLSRIPVSVPGLALRQAGKEFSSLSGKKLMILGASGEVGGIVLKDALDIPGLEIYAAIRRGLPENFHALQAEREEDIYPAKMISDGNSHALQSGRERDVRPAEMIPNGNFHALQAGRESLAESGSHPQTENFQTERIAAENHGIGGYHPQTGKFQARRASRARAIPYENRYQYLDDMDVVVSATSSPHYTITAEHYREVCRKKKKRVLIDLAVPCDIESGVRDEHTVLYTMEDMEGIAAENNRKKQHCVPGAKVILEKYEQEFYKGRLCAENREMIDRAWETIDATEKNDRWHRFVFGLKKTATAEEFEIFLRLLREMVK